MRNIMDWKKLKTGTVIIYKGLAVYDIEIKISEKESVVIGYDYPYNYNGKIGYFKAPKWIQNLVLSK